ncbi:hypothetical protein AAC691_10165 [Nguyenibacter vanlangensis]|uniref:Uncharacterized protein n=1 Tax=Nguyenibacter vanlangensis TaxID=1216886 RepID=A0ABZ3DAE8_9PROT
MDRLIALITSLLLGLFGLIVTAIAMIEHVVRQILAGMGILGELQTALLVILLVALIVGAFRVFGGVFSILIGTVLVLILLHALLGVAGVPLR